MADDDTVLRAPTDGTLEAEIAELRTRLSVAEQRIAATTQEKVQLEALLSRAPIGFAQFDRELRYLRINDRLAEINGLPAAAHVGRTVAEVVPSLAPLVAEVTQRIVATGQVVLSHEFCGETPREPGVQRFWTESWYPVHGMAGDIVGFGVLVEEITDRKRAEAAREESAERLRLAAAAARLGTFEWNLRTGVNVWSPELEALYDLAPGEFGGTQRRWEQLVHPDDVQGAVAKVNEALASGLPVEHEWRTVWRDGSEHWILGRFQAYADERGQPLRLVGVNLDITARRRAEQQLSLELEGLTRLHQAGVLRSADGQLEPVLLAIVDAAIAMTGADFGDIQLLDPASGDLRIAAQRGLPPWWLEFWDSVAVGHGACGTALERGERIIVEDVEQSPLFKGQPALEIQLRANVRAVQSTPLIGRSGRPIGILSTHYRTPHRLDDRTQRMLDLLTRQAADVIDREQAHAALSEQQAVLRSFYDSAPFLMGLAELDGDQVIAVSGNRAMASFLGVTPEQLPGRTAREIGNPGHVDQLWLQHYRSAERDGIPVHFSYEHPRPTGAVWLSATVSYVGRAPTGRPRFAFVVDDVTVRRRHEAALRESEERFRTMADGAPVIIWVTDATGQVEFINGEYCQFFGVTVSQVCARDGWQPLVHEDDRAYIGAFVEAVRTASPFQAEARVRRADGEWRWISSRGIPRLSADGTFNGHVGCSYDVTDAKQLRSLEQEAARQKDQFIAILAHELRNPLAPIRTSVALLRAQGPADPLMMRCRDVIDRQAAHMSRLLDDLLDVSRLSRGALTLQRAPLVLRDAIEAAMDVTRPLVEQQRHTLTLDWRAGNIVIQGDSARLTQVIGNLLINAAKYTPSGGTIDLSVAREDGDVVVSVRDTGVGIDADRLDTIFDLFARGDGAPSHGAGGLGIGLALAKRLIEMHGGTLRATSPGPGRGSEFVVRLPAAVVDGGSIVETRPSFDDSWRGRRVLVVDDNVDSAEMLGYLFAQWGADVRTVHDGESAWRSVQELTPDIILLDLGMPMPDGYEVCRRIRQQWSGSRITIVALTGWGQEEDRRRTEQAGFDGHIVKPVDPATLFERLRALLPNTIRQL